VPGRLPPIASGTGPLFIWPGLSNPTSDLIQTTLDAWGNNNSACGAATGQWCGETSIFGSFGQLSGTSFAFDPDDHITIVYQLGSDNTTWTQTMTSQKAGKVVSTFSRASGAMLGNGFGFATEADQDSYTIDTQYYLCTEFHLFQADPTWGPKSGGGNGAKYGATGTGSGPGTAKNLRTPDGGLTWLVDVITLPAMNPQGTQTPVPTYNCSGGGGASGTGGAPGTGGMAATGGKAATGGMAAATGGMAATGGARTGGAPGTGGTRATGGSPGAGGAVATGGRPSTGGNVAMATGGLNGIGGNLTTGGRPSTGGNVNGATGGTPNTGGLVGNGGTGGAMANTGGKTGTSVSTTTAAGGSNAIAGSGNNVGGSALAGDSSTSPGTSDNAGTCSCSIPGKNAPRGLLALAIGGAALALRRRRERRAASGNPR
jgi:MYXO-CTERM domain-containing protein